MPPVLIAAMSGRCRSEVHAQLVDRCYKYVRSFIRADLG
jgi:hypothetical protein